MCGPYLKKPPALKQFVFSFISPRLAAIKQLLCVHDEAIKEYKLILEMQHDYVPALKGGF